MSYKILLLSDIHLLAKADEFDPHYGLRLAFLRDIKDYKDSCGSIDAIFICGDIASTGKEQEYVNAKEFLSTICQKVNCPEHEIYTVPGNHDKDFGAANPHLRHLLHLGLAHEVPASHLRFQDLLTGDFDTIKLLYTPFENYHNFAFSYDSAESLMSRCLLEDKPFYHPQSDQTFLEKKLTNINGFDIYLYGLNTAIASDWYDIDDSEGREHGHYLFLPNYRFCVEQENRVNIALMHHPLNCVKEGNIITEEFDSKFHVQIFGHLHQPSSRNNNSVHIFSGALQPPYSYGENQTQYFSVFNIIELDVMKNPGPSLKVSLKVEKYCPDKGFENYKPETKNYSVPLKDGHSNRWENDKNAPDKKQMDISSRKIIVKFLQSRNPKQYIKQLGNYDDNLSLPLNCKLFLQKMEADGKLNDLWNLLEE